MDKIKCACGREVGEVEYCVGCHRRVCKTCCYISAVSDKIYCARCGDDIEEQESNSPWSTRATSGGLYILKS